MVLLPVTSDYLGLYNLIHFGGDFDRFCNFVYPVESKRNGAGENSLSQDEGGERTNRSRGVINAKGAVMRREGKIIPQKVSMTNSYHYQHRRTNSQERMPQGTLY